MNKSFFKAIFVIILGLGLFTSQASGVERFVDCDKGQSIQSAVEGGPSASRDPYVIYINGTCNENVIIRTRNLIIDGDNSATIVGFVNIFVRDVRLQYLTITGPGRGVFASTAAVRLTSVNITQNAEEGLKVRRGGFVWLINSTISENGGPGVIVEGASLDAAQGSVIRDNALDGILADLGGNVIVRNAVITGNVGSGVSANMHSVVDFRERAQVFSNGEYGAFAKHDSALRISTEDVFFPDSIGCDDKESSFENEGAVPTGSVSCPINVALGKTVASSGLFFVGGFGALQTVDLGSVVDGVFFEPGQNWTAGSVWWREDVDTLRNKLTIYLGKTFEITKLIVQVDNNDDYRVSWNDDISGANSVIVSPTFIPFPGGLAVPVEVDVSAVTDQFTIEHVGAGRGDGFYSVSEFQAIGKH
jgi:hypothetical protein